MAQSKRKRKNKARLQFRTWFSSRAIQGHWWARFFALVGGRGAGKTTDIQRFLVKQWRTTGTPFMWLRLTDAEIKKIKQNGARNAFDAVVVRQFPELTDLKIKGDDLYCQGKLICSFKSLSTFQNDKGSALYDALCDQWSYIMLDEMNKAAGSRSSGDPVYQFANAMETILRTKKTKIKIFMIGNLEGLSSMMAGVFNWVPLEGKFGIYKLRKKKAVIQYFDDTEAFKKQKAESTSSLIDSGSSTFTNVLAYNTTLIDKHSRLVKPIYRIKFVDNSYIVWSAQGVPYQIITRDEPKKPLLPVPLVIPMERLLDAKYDKKSKDRIIQGVNGMCYHFRNLITQELFRQSMMMMKQ